MAAKTGIRREIRERRRQLDPEWVRRASERIGRRMLALAEWKAARRVCCYLAAPGEVQTDLIVAAGRKDGKCLWVPAFHPERARYECARLAPDAALAPGRHGIPEPARPAWADKEAFDLAIVPGLAFDRRGGRIGHGGGHYDGLLAQAALKNAVKIGLAFAFQLRAAVPAMERDAAMDIVVTEDGVIRCRGE